LNPPATHPVWSTLSGENDVFVKARLEIGEDVALSLEAFPHAEYFSKNFIAS